jgi:hypothetical protein
MRQFAAWIGVGVMLLPLIARGQEITARLDISRRDAQPDFIAYCSLDGGMVTLGPSSKKSSRYLSVTKYDGLFKRVWGKQVHANNGRNGIDLLTALGDRIFVFSSEYLPRESTLKTRYTSLDFEGNILQNQVEIESTPDQKEWRVDLQYEHSVNKRKLLCYRNLAQGLRNEKISYHLFDSESDSVVSGFISLPFPDDKFQVRKIVVDNDGYIYLIGKYYISGRVRNPEDYGFLLYRYQPGNPDGERLDIELGELFINDLTIKAGKEGNVFLAGFYSHHSSDEIIGSCFFRISDSLQVAVQSTQRFSDEFLKNFLRDVQIERGRELRNFYLDNIILRSDGGALLIAEKYYTTYNTYVDMYGYMVDQRIHHYDDVIVSSVAANGDLEWSAVARKRQQSESRDHLSYLDVVSGNTLFLVYTYNPPRDPRSLYVQEVGMDGSVTERRLLLGSLAQDELFYPRSSLQINNQEALLYYYQERNKIYSIVKVAF